MNEKSQEAKWARHWSLRHYLPYGKWITNEDREVLFNRSYQPIFEKSNGIVKVANRAEWINGIVDEKTEYFYNDSNPPRGMYEHHGSLKTLRKCIDILKNWGVFDHEGGKQWR